MRPGNSNKTQGLHFQLAIGDDLFRGALGPLGFFGVASVTLSWGPILDLAWGPEGRLGPGGTEGGTGGAERRGAEPWHGHRAETRMIG